jgi:hypothetical protein
MKFVSVRFADYESAPIPGTRSDERNDHRRELPMLLLIALTLGILWVAVLAVILGVCASAAAGDRVLQRAKRSAQPAESGRLRLIA